MATLFGAVLFLAAAGLAAEPPPAAEREAGTYAGRPLAEVLRELQDGGLAIFFTSSLVRPEMRVLTEPDARAPRAILDQLLAPHDLRAEPGPGGRLVVVAVVPGESAIHGRVRERHSRRALAGVRVLIPGAGHEATTGADGTFRLPDVTAGSHVLEAHLPGFVVQRIPALVVPPRETVEILIELDPAPIALDEIVVTPSSLSLLRQEPTSALDLDRDDILALPHLGDDVFRALTLLPGVTGEEVSARFNVRGGRSDEVLVLLDRVELFEPYHLKDFSSSLSIIAPRSLREVNLITGGFPAEYGDRMSGVLDMTTQLPEQRLTHLGLGILSAEAGSSGTFAGERGNWLATLRRGSLDLTLDFVGEKQQPRYWDGFGKAQYQLSPGQRLGLHLLHSEDDLDFRNADPDNIEIYLTGYGNSYFWLTHQGVLSTRLFADLTASIGRVDRDRSGVEIDIVPIDADESGGFTIFDRRRLDVAGLKQDWNLQAGDDHYLKWGFETRRLITDYDYFNEVAIDDPLEDFRGSPRLSVPRFQRRLSGEQYSAYLSDRLRPVDPLTVELGVRYDEHSLTADRNLSPRLNLVYSLGSTGVLRLAWGYFYQTQRPYELQIEDGSTELAPAERTEQLVVGFERGFTRRAGGSELLLRVEAYQRDIRDPRLRFENVFEPISIFPEIEPDRIAIDPDSGSAYGLEIFVRGALGPRIDWWASYTWSRVEDRIAGRDVPRRIDQPHALNVDLNYRVGEHWNLNLAWRYHTGWPTTAIAGRLEIDEDGEPAVALVLGPLNAERLPAYHRLDLRASREWRKRRGVLGFFLEIQNLYDRGNLAGFDFDIEPRALPAGENLLTPAQEVWGGFLPSFGITWEF